ncbi:MAG: RNA methyltransferase [Firmicutes bacterium]|nr:RNA methyltransferase [Bacillota bacterium]
MEGLPIITSRENQYVKLACSLKTRKGRRLSGCFLLEGLRLAEEALAAKWHINYMLLCEEMFARPRMYALINSLLKKNVPAHILPAALFKQMADTEHSQGILLIARHPSLSEEIPAKADFLLLADHLADPGNLGAIMRTAWAAGVDALILTAGCADPFSPKAARASMGAVLRLPCVIFDNETAFLTLLQERGFVLYAAAADGQSRYDSVDLKQPLIWMFGAEATGLSPFWKKSASFILHLPMAVGAESINVAAAAAVLLYATAAQRGFPKAR